MIMLQRNRTRHENIQPKYLSIKHQTIQKPECFPIANPFNLFKHKKDNGLGGLGIQK